jgi:hypothetical protein
MHALVVVHAVRFAPPPGLPPLERLCRTAHSDRAMAHRHAARHVRTLGDYLVDAGLDETAGYAKGRSAAEPVGDAFIVRACPRLAASARWFRREEWDATFDLGLEALLAAVERGSAA